MSIDSQLPVPATQDNRFASASRVGSHSFLIGCHWPDGYRSWSDQSAEPALSLRVYRLTARHRPTQAAVIFKGGTLNKILDRNSANDQSTAFAVDVTERRLGNNNSIQSARVWTIYVNASIRAY